jgi:hypothetical protein
MIYLSTFEKLALYKQYDKQFPNYCAGTQSTSIHVIQVTDAGIQQQGDKELKYTHVIFKNIVNDKTPEMSKTSTEIHIALTLQKQWLLCTTCFNIKMFCIIFTGCIYGFCLILRLNANCFPKRH